MIIFDLDGTLADTLPDVAAAINAARKEMNRPPLSPDQIRKAIGPGKDDFLRAVFPDTERPDEGLFLNLFRSHYWDHCLDNTALFPGMDTVLESLDCPLAVASNKPRRFIEKILEGLNIIGKFQTRLSADDVEEAKPHPEMILRILRIHGVNPERSLMVGDTDKDILAGQRAGTQVCAVRYGYGSLEMIRLLEPDYLIETPMDLLKTASVSN